MAATVYEIYIRSFQDSNDDGVGDLQGIVGRLDYLSELGVDAVWLTPFYPSPQVDFGYDVADHEDVDPQFGTLADFDRLIAAAHGRGIKVIVDVVLNHTSDQHPWFLSSRTGRTSPLRDWYIWRDGAVPGKPPNNWESAFGGPAWTFDPASDQWYYHFFYAGQPDLNWRNPAVEERMFATLKFWIDRGVDGFRLDAVNTLFEDPGLRDNPVLPAPAVSLTGIRTQDFVQTRRLPEVHDVLRRLRAFVDRCAPHTVLISEAYVDTVGELVRFYGEGDNRDGMHLPFNFFLAQVPSLDGAAFRRAVEAVEDACAGRWPSQVLSNHDIDRACDRFASGPDTDPVARLLATMLLTLRGTPFIYYGEEIGTRTEPPRRIEEVRDPVGRHFWPRYKGRDGVRRPMAWTGAPGAGFTGGTPWLPIGEDGARRNVAAQKADAGSLLHYYRALLALRRRSPAITSGDYRSVDTVRDVFAYVRQSGDDRLLVILNMANDPRPFALRSDQAMDVDRWTVALGTHRAAGTMLSATSATLAPFEALVLRG
jgi:alpha-glucosidase